MAIDIVKALRNAKKAQETGLSSTTTSYDPAKQVAGYEKRLTAAGVDVASQTDDRNFLEKILNLNQKQGFFADIFEVLDRPLNTFAGGLVALAEGKDFADGLWKGLTGEEENTYVDVLKSIGVEDGWATGLGFAANIFLDPMNWPTGGFGKMSQLTKLAGTINDVDNIDDIRKTVAQAAALSQGLTSSGENAMKFINSASGVMDAAQARSLINKMARKSLTNTGDLVGKGVAFVIGKTASTSGKVIKKTLTAAADMKLLKKESVENLFKGVKSASQFVGSLFGAVNSISEATKVQYNKVLGALDLQNQLLFRKLQDEASGFDKIYKSMITKIAADTGVQESVIESMSFLMQELPEGTELTDVVTRKANAVLVDAIEGTYKNTDSARTISYTTETVTETTGKGKNAVSTQVTKKVGRVKTGAGATIIDEAGNEVKLASYEEDLLQQMDANPNQSYYIFKNKDGKPIKGGKNFEATAKHYKEQLATLGHDDVVFYISNTSPANPDLIMYKRNKDGSLSQLMTAELKDASNDTGRFFLRSPKAAEDNFEVNGIFNDLKKYRGNVNSLDSTLTKDKLISITYTLKDGEVKTRIFNGLEYKQLIMNLDASIMKRYGEIQIKGVGEFKTSDFKNARFGLIDKNGNLVQEIYADTPKGRDLIIEASTTRSGNAVIRYSADHAESFEFVMLDANGKAVPRDYYIININAPKFDEFINNPEKMKAAGLEINAMKDIELGKGNVRLVGGNATKTSFQKLFSGFTNSGKYVALDQKAYNALAELMKDPKVAAKFDITKMFKQIDNSTNNGLIAFELTEEGKTDLKAMMAMLSDDPDLKKLFEADIDIPRFFTAEQFNAYNTLTKNKDFMDLTASFTKIKVDSLKALDNVFGNMTNFADQYGKNYMRHSLNEELYGELKKISPDYYETTVGSLKNNVAALAARKYDMYAMEVNNIMNLKFKNTMDPAKYQELLTKFNATELKLFNDDLQKSFSDFFIEAGKKGKEAVLLNLLIEQDLTTTQANGARSILKAFDPEAGASLGYEIVRTSDFDKVSKELSRFMGDEQAKKFIDNISKFVKKTAGDGDKILVDKNVYRMIGRLGNPAQNQNDILKVFDWVNENFKKFKLFTPGFQFRNIVGNYTNLALSGLSSTEVLSLSSKMPDYWKVAAKGDSLLTKVAVSGIDALDDAEKEIYGLYKEFVEAGFLHASYNINDLEKVLEKAKEGGNFVDKALGFSASANEYVDRMYRIALFDYARKNPQIYLSGGFQSAAEYVRFALFDPQDLTGFEKDIMRRIIPFYTFTKKNLMYQATNLLKNPTSYRTLSKILDFSYDLVDVDKKDVPDYQVENMWIPIPFTNANGEFMTFRASLPASDLNEWIKDPMKKLLSSFTPVLRAPYEVATNTQIYTGLPISEFKGQKGYNLPFVDRWAEYGLSQFGIDAPISTVYNAISGEIPDALGVSKTNLAKEQTARAYEQRDKLQELMRYYKQEGVRIPTIAEIENSTENSRIDNVLSILRG